MIKSPGMPKDKQRKRHTKHDVVTSLDQLKDGGHGDTPSILRKLETEVKSLLAKNRELEAGSKGLLDGLNAANARAQDEIAKRSHADALLERERLSLDAARKATAERGLTDVELQVVARIATCDTVVVPLPPPFFSGGRGIHREYSGGCRDVGGSLEEEARRVLHKELVRRGIFQAR